MGEIITGNELESGATVYWGAGGGWLEDIDKARIFASHEAEERDRIMEQARATHRILSLEIESAGKVDGRVVADRLRERIRAEGPTTPRMPRQTLSEDDHVSL